MAASFNTKAFEKKLKSLETSQTGIQTLSLWILHHRHHAKVMAASWGTQISKEDVPSKRLGLFYLANDVVQNGKRKAKELVFVFGKAILEAMVFFREESIKGQVDRVFKIWVERGVYDASTIKNFRKVLHDHSPPKEDEKKSQVKLKKPVPTDFKVSKLLVAIKKSSSLDNDLTRKSKQLENLAIDVSSFDSVKHVKGRSSVDKFHKQFDESKVVLEDYCTLLRRAVKDKNNLLLGVTAGEAYYDAAQEEAKVIVNAYKTFGNRLKAMKKKLDAKVAKMEPANSSSGTHEHNTTDETIIQDMDLDDSGDELSTTTKRETYNPETAPLHASTPAKPRTATTTSFISPENMNGMASFLQGDKPMLELSIDTTMREEKDKPMSLCTTPISPAAAPVISKPPDEQTPVYQLQQLPTLIQPNVMVQQQQQPTVFGFMPPIVPISNTQGEHTTPTTPVQDEKTHVVGNPDNKPLQSLIDSLFPMLSKSLQTIKEKTEQPTDNPSINSAIAFALGVDTENSAGEKKPTVSADTPPLVSPLSLTNPQGLSDNQTELINIAAGITKLDENFQPVTPSSEPNLSRQNSREKEKESSEKNEKTEKRKSSRHSDKSSKRHKDDRSQSPPSRKSSSSKSRDGSPHNRRSRSSRDSRDKDKRRSSKRSSQSPRRRKTRSNRSRSTSRERDETRNSSPDKKPYYNDRRSPTPEMDGTHQPQAFTNNFETNSANPAFSQMDNATPQPIPTVDQKPAAPLPNVPDMGMFFPMVNNPPPGGMQINQLAPPSVISAPPPNLTFDMNGRPVLQPGMPLRPILPPAQNPNLILPLQSNGNQLNNDEPAIRPISPVSANPPPFPGPPPAFPGPMPRPPPFPRAAFSPKDNVRERAPAPARFNEDYRPRRAEPDHLLDKLEHNQQNVVRPPPPHFSNNVPIFRPRYSNRPPIYRPRFVQNARPPFRNEGPPPHNMMR